MTMNLDDESLLSAYLDDELDERERSRLDSAFRNDPAMVRRLRELAKVRSLLADLPSFSAPVDIPLRVVVLIDRRQMVRRLVATTTALTVAAAVLVALTLAFAPGSAPSAPGDQPAPIVASNDSPGSADPSNSTDVANPLAVADTGPGTAEELAKTSETILPTDPLRELYHQQIGRLLERPGIRRIVVTVPELTSQAIEALDQEVNGFVRQRPAFTRFDVGSALELDPEYPGEAVIFAVELQRAERHALVARIAESERLSATLREDRPSAGTLLQLAEIETFEIGEGRRGALLIAGDEALSRLQSHAPKSFLKAPKPLGPVTVRPHSPELSPRGDFLRPRGRSDSARNSEARPSVAGAPPATSDPEVGSDDVATVLIWLRADSEAGGP
jgi:hypothetical protein